MQLVSGAENSSLSWRAHFDYIEDIGHGRGDTADIIGFCSGTGDMFDLAGLYKAKKPGNALEKHLTALRSSGCASARTSGRRCSTYSALPRGLTQRGGQITRPATPRRFARSRLQSRAATQVGLC
ncbi:chitosanase [Saccharothrix yanglingensis]|uniref:Uncharacterized protein n=1 Tax=Saccharothrix yanglingensis TaxID=659496 RepID=A0ABU0X734_9PSEU|nr:hypothetical protein [Saccharothrix yanglingensis]